MDKNTRIKLVRTDKGLTQAQLGELCGVSGEMIRQYEAGLRNPKLETVKKIASALDVTYQYLLDLENDDMDVLNRLFGEKQMADIAFWANASGRPLYAFMDYCLSVGLARVSGDIAEENPDLAWQKMELDFKAGEREG